MTFCIGKLATSSVRVKGFQHLFTVACPDWSVCYISSPVDLRRHVSCEPCIGRVNGGYDPQTNQVRNGEINRYFLIPPPPPPRVLAWISKMPVLNSYSKISSRPDFTNLL